jgi:hypothetical protein
VLEAGIDEDDVEADAVEDSVVAAAVEANVVENEQADVVSFVCKFNSRCESNVVVRDLVEGESLLFTSLRRESELKRD